MSPYDRKVAAFLRDLDELVRLGIMERGPIPGSYKVTVSAEQLAAALYARMMRRGPDPDV